MMWFVLDCFLEVCVRFFFSVFDISPTEAVPLIHLPNYKQRQLLRGLLNVRVIRIVHATELNHSEFYYGPSLSLCLALPLPQSPSHTYVHAHTSIRVINSE